MRRYEYPHVVHFVEDLPRTLTGKVQRFRLREWALQAAPGDPEGAAAAAGAAGDAATGAPGSTYASPASPAR